MIEHDRARALLVLLAMVAALFTVAPPARAVDPLIRTVDVNGDEIQIVLRDGRTSGSSPLGDVVVRLDGRELATSVTSQSDPDAPVERRTAVLLVDTSGSMQGDGIRGARQAAGAYLKLVPADVRVGLTTFSDRVRTVVPPTTDRAALIRAVEDLQAQGSTALNDGVLEAVRRLGEKGERRIVLLSDGADSSSASTLLQAVASTRSSGVQLSAVAFGSDTSSLAALDRLSRVAGGRVVRAGDDAALAEAFRGAAREFSGVLQVAAQLPADASGRTVQLQVDVQHGDQQVSASQDVAVPAFGLGTTVTGGGAPAAAAPADSTWFGSTASLPWAAGSLFLGLLALLALAIGSGDTQADGARRTRRVLARYTLASPLAESPAQPGALGDSSVARAALGLAGRITTRRGIEQDLALQLDRAALPLRPEEWVLLRFLAVCTGGALMFLLVQSGLLGLALGLLLGFALPKTYLNLRISRRQKAFAEALPDALQLVAGALSSGYSLAQALDTVVREGSEPIAGEVGRALTEARLGLPLEDALEAVGERMCCEDFKWVVMAIRVQREVGGNLAGVLTTVTHTLRERARLRRQVRSLSAEGRLSAYVLVGLPILLGAYMYLFRNDYFRPMYTTPVGIGMLVATAVSLVVGTVWMNKLVKVEV